MSDEAFNRRKLIGMHKKITPLVIVSIICIAFAIYALFPSEPENKERSGVYLPWIMPLFLLFGALLAYGIDRLIRKRSPDLKKVWIVEVVLVGLIALYSLFLK